MPIRTESGNEYRTRYSDTGPTESTKTTLPLALLQVGLWMTLISFQPCGKNCAETDKDTRRKRIASREKDFINREIKLNSDKSSI